LRRQKGEDKKAAYFLLYRLDASYLISMCQILRGGRTVAHFDVVLLLRFN
jgi:hypothetical protein